MIAPNTEACLVVLGLESTAGFFSSLLIIVCLTLASLKKKKLTSCNSILICLSSSGASFSVISYANLLIGFAWPRTLSSTQLYVFYVMHYIYLFTISSFSGSTSILCFFYFIKICQFKPGFLAWIKINIDKMVPWSILTLIPASFLCSFVLFLDSGLSKNATKPQSDLSLDLNTLKMNLMRLNLILNSLSFIISLLSTLGCVFFLKLQRSSGKFGSTKVRTYQTAVHTMIFLVSYYALIYLVVVLYGLQIFPLKSWGYWMCLMAIFSFSHVQTVIIICRNPKLRQALRRVFTFRFLLNH